MWLTVGRVGRLLCSVWSWRPFFTRHEGFNQTLADVGRVAGCQVLMEQVTPELSYNEDGSVVIKKAQLDCDFFGHAYAPNHIIDGTIRHPSTKSSLAGAMKTIGAIVEASAEIKLKKYPAKNGKAVLPCSIESWGFLGKHLSAFLQKLAGLAGWRQRDRGTQPTK